MAGSRDLGAGMNAVSKARRSAVTMTGRDKGFRLRDSEPF
jgi:hypothetical protein